MNMINMATAPELAGGMPGDPLMSDQEMQIFLDAFAISGFTGGINWYRNFSRNWEIIGAFEQYIHQPTLMIYGDYDMVPKSENLEDFVGDLTVHSFPCGHWIQQERPEDTNTALLNWLGTKYPT